MQIHLEHVLRSIAVVNWPEKLFLDHYNPAPGILGKVAIRTDKLFMNVWNCVAIERRSETEKSGKYLLIFKGIDMEKAKESIGNLIQAFGRKSDRKRTKLALEKFQEFPEFDSIQRVSQLVYSKGLQIREMLETAASQRMTNTPKKIKQPKFLFHVEKDLQ
jgi:predicted HTH domain antitoxin